MIPFFKQYTLVCTTAQDSGPQPKFQWVAQTGVPCLKNKMFHPPIPFPMPAPLPDGPSAASSNLLSCHHRSTPMPPPTPRCLPPPGPPPIKHSHLSVTKNNHKTTDARPSAAFATSCRHLRHSAHVPLLAPTAPPWTLSPVARPRFAVAHHPSMCTERQCHTSSLFAYHRRHRPSTTE